MISTTLKLIECVEVFAPTCPRFGRWYGVKHRLLLQLQLRWNVNFGLAAPPGDRRPPLLRNHGGVNGVV